MQKHRRIEYCKPTPVQLVIKQFILKRQDLDLDYIYVQGEVVFQIISRLSKSESLN